MPPLSSSPPSSQSSHYKIYSPFRLFSFLILLLMGSAIVYALGISVHYWTGIGV